jgi:membrane protein implicated in regulation of membrane protease activity
MITLNISEWWLALTIAQKIFWCIAIPFSLLFILQTIMTFVGLGAEDVDATGDSDTAIHGDAGIEFQFITLKNLIAFFTIFGWTGIACLAGGMGIPLTIVISFAAGLLMMVIMAGIIYLMGKLSDDGTLKIKNAIGKSGVVYLPIPPGRQGTGQVQIKVQGLQTLDAMTDDPRGFKTGQVVEVTQVLNGDILLVR